MRPHPHINLATIPTLFAGAIEHRDSLGTQQLIAPGAVNLMTAGHGIVHSEGSPVDERASGAMLDGIQTWLAMPEADEERAPPSSTSRPSTRRRLPLVPDDAEEWIPIPAVPKTVSYP